MSLGFNGVELNMYHLKNKAFRVQHPNNVIKGRSQNEVESLLLGVNATGFHLSTWNVSLLAIYLSHFFLPISMIYQTFLFAQGIDLDSQSTILAAPQMFVMYCLVITTFRIPSHSSKSLPDFHTHTFHSLEFDISLPACLHNISSPLGIATTCKNERL